jgi:proteasome lid subunit RPN8/RPN11
MSDRTIADMAARYVDDPAAPERCGFVLQTGEVAEVENKCHDPANGFDISGDDLLKYEDLAVGSWHTHTGTDSNLTRDDLISFLNYPHLKHYIIGSDGVACYVVQKGQVIREAHHSSARKPEEHPPRSDRGPRRNRRRGAQGDHPAAARVPA